jgi:hypothetical protein
MLLIEWGFVLVAVLLAFTCPELGSRWFARSERAFATLARRRGLAIFATGLTALALRVMLLPLLPIPKPGVHDEFSYLLMADTFARGRLTNPTHPMWAHFETFHVIQKPTYASMYFPAQGVFLAAGQVVFHHPFWGVWLSAGLMCAAICWMLQGWLPPFWALLGGFLAVIRLATFSYWVNTYFGGTGAALGGALVLGALPRIKRRQGLSDVVLMGLGLALLANSRPYEGFFFALPVAVALLLWIFSRRGVDRTQALGQIVFPLAGILLATAATMLYYFWRVTGSPFQTPFFVNLATYDPVPYFPWESVKSWPVYHHEIMRRFYTGWLLDYYQFGRNHPVIAVLVKSGMFWCFYLGPLFTIPILMLGMVLPRGFSVKNISRRTRFLLIVASIAFFGTMLPVFTNPHYAAPMTCVAYALLLSALQCIRHWRWRGKPTGIALVRSIPTVAIVMLVTSAGASLLKIHRSSMPQTWCSPYEQVWDRPSIQARMEKLPGRHLLLVRYSPEHDPRSSWVANGADIDGSKVVWANDMGQQQNQELIEYFKDRKVWLVEPDAVPARLSDYTDVAWTPSAQDRF